MRFIRLQTLTIVFSLLAVVGFLANITAPKACAQVTTAAIHGTVTDISGAVVPDAQITALNTATGITTTTTSNHSGFFTYQALQIGGPYVVTVESAGFQKFQSTGIVLTVNANFEVNAKLKVGAMAETVRVDASTLQVETSNTQLQQTVPDSQIETLPLLGRDAASLQKLAPGTVESSDRFGSFSSNGSQTTSNSYVLDGVDVNDGPLQSEGFSVNPDALEEENIVTSTINPEFSRNGGAVVNQIIKSGTNQIHGSGFENYRDTFMNNGNYFSQTRPPFHRNLYGGTLGGPIFKNKLFGFVAYQGFRSRTGATTETPVYQTGILSSGAFTNEYNEASETTNGALGLGVNTYDANGNVTASNPIPFVINTTAGSCGPGTSNTTWYSCFPANSTVTIAPTNFNSIASTLANKYVPAGNAGTTTAPEYNFNTANTGASDQGILRADYHLSDKDAFSGTGMFQSSPATRTISFGGASLPGFGMISAEHFKIFAASETHTFNSKTLNMFRLGYYRFNYAAVEPAKIVDPSSLGFDISPQSASSGVPYINVTGLFKLGNSYEGPQPRKDSNLTGSDNFSLIVGNHSLKFGVNVEQFRVSNPYYADNNGAYSFAGGGTYSSGDPGLDFLLGIPDSYVQSSGGFIDAQSWEYYAFAQDSYRATSDLTLNLGLAYDVETPNQNNQFGGEGITCFQVTSTTSTVFTGGFPGLFFPGDPGCNKAGGATTKRDHFGPRFGFAWSPSAGPAGLIGDSGAHKLAVRGGFGVYFNRDQEEGQLQNLGDVPNYKQSNGAADFSGSPAFANPFADVAGNGSETNPFPYSRPQAGSTLNWANYLEQDISAIDSNYSTPYVMNFNLNIQRQLPGNMILQVGYVGSLGRRLASTYEADPITSAGHTACLASSTCEQHSAYQHLYFPSHAAQPATTTVSGEAIPDFMSVGTLATYGKSNYNSLQASVVKNLSHGLYFTLAYTFSHGLDDSSGLESSGFNGLGKNNISGFQYLSYGDSDYDARHRFVASYDYEIPILASMKSNYVVKEVLSQWHVAGVTVLQTGFPVTVTNEGTYRSLWCDAYSYYSCPDNVNTSSFKIKSQNIRTTGTWFDRSVFSNEAYGAFGNAKRNFFHGPGYNYTNLSIFKNFPIGSNSARSVQVMLQASNAFNHANFAPPDSNYTDGQYFGTVTSVLSSADYNGDPAGGRTVQLVGKFTF
jgi:hypothetical protein